MERFALIVCLILSAACGVSEYFFDLSTEAGQIAHTNLYMAISAFSWLFIVASVRFATKDKPTQYLSEFMLVLAFSQVLDELFFNPTIIQVNEVILFIGGLLWVLYRFQYIKIGRNG